MTDVHDGMLFSQPITGTGSFRTSPVGSFHGHPIGGVRIDVNVRHGGFGWGIVFGQKTLQDKGPSKLFRFRFVIGRSHKLAKVLVGDQVGIQKEGFHLHDVGWMGASILGVGLKMPKGFGPFFADAPVAAFPEGFVSCFGGMLFIGQIVQGPKIGMIGMIVGVQFLWGNRLFVGGIERRAKNILDGIVAVKAQSSHAILQGPTHVNHVVVVLLIGIGMIVQIGANVVVVVLLVFGGVLFLLLWLLGLLGRGLLFTTATSTTTASDTLLLLLDEGFGGAFCCHG